MRMPAGSKRRLATAVGPRSPRERLDVTVVLPAYNEEGTIRDTHARLDAALRALRRSYEFVFVDDGSTDGTWKVISEVAEHDPRVRALRHRANSGKASALAAGFAVARGDIVSLCDADLQYEPADLAKIVKMAGQCGDAVTAYKIVRRDPLSKRLPSRFFNFFLRESMHVELHDMNAGLKAMTREAAHELIRFGYGGLHRFFMVILAKKGFTVSEMPVESLPRPAGKSKYGAERYLRGALDFLTVFFLSGYVERPLNLFGGIGVGLVALGSASFLLDLLIGRFTVGGLAFSVLTPTAILMVVSGIQLIVIGLVAEMINNLERVPILRGEISESIRIDGEKGLPKRTRVDLRDGDVSLTCPYPTAPTGTES